MENKQILDWLNSKNYQKEQGDQEYMMYFDVDMPKILNDFLDYVKNLKPNELRAVNRNEAAKEFCECKIKGSTFQLNTGEICCCKCEKERKQND